MSYTLDNKLVIAISSRALFDLEEENLTFETDGLEAYYKYQLERESTILSKGVGFRLVKNLLRLNEGNGEKIVEVIIMSRNNAATSLRITKSIEHYGLDITRSAWSGGADISYTAPICQDNFPLFHL